MSITLRNAKGTPLSHDEMDANFSVLTGSIDAGDGLSGGGAISGSVEFAVNATVARTGSNTFTGPQNIQSSLEVQGNINVGGTVTAQEFHTEFVSGSIIFVSGSTKFGDTSNDIHSFSGSLQVSGSGNHFFTDGNVGIGTTSPGYKLDISGDSASGVVAIRNAANNRDTLRSENAAGTRTFNIGNDSSGHGLVLVRNSSGTTTNYIAGSGNSYFNGGNVGIGTTSPLNALHVESSINQKALFTNTDFVNGSAGTSLDINFGATSGNTYTEIRSLINGRSAWGDFLLARGGGNVGIGTTTTDSLLHLSGSSNNAIVTLENNGNGNVSGIDFVRERSTGAGVNGGSIFVESNTGHSHSSMYIQTQTSSAGAGVTSALTDNNGVRVILGGGSGVGSFIVENGSSESLRINKDGNVGIGVTSITAVGSRKTLHLDNSAGSAIRLSESATDVTFLSYDSTSFFRLSSSDQIALLTSGTERLRIDSSGSVGIGTSTPSSSLDVHGNIYAGDGNTDNNIRAYFSDNSYTELRGYGIQFSRDASYIRPTVDSTKTMFFGVDSLQWDTIQLHSLDFQFKQNNSVSMRLDTSGDLLIGGTSKLTGYSSTFRTLSIQTPSGDNASILELAGNRNANSGNQNAMIQFFNKTGTATEVGRISSIQGSDVTSGSITFHTNDSGTLSEKVRIDSNGNVGIGTTSMHDPAKLSISGSGVSVHRVRTETNSELPLIVGSQWVNGYVSGSAGMYHLEQGTGGYGQAGGLIFKTSTNDATPTERMRINSSGNVGIGTTSPIEKLEVAGNAILNASNANLKIRAGSTGTKGDIQWTFNTDSTVYASAGIEYDNRGTDGFLIDSGYPITLDYASSYIRFSNNGSEKMRLDTSGNLGIGTTSPAKTLHIFNSDDIQIRLSQSGSGTYDIGVVDGDKFAINQDGQTNQFVLSSGNVGIGTTSPNAVGSRRTIHIDNSAGSAIRLRESSTDLAFLSYDSTSFFRLSSSDQLALLTGGSERLRIDSSGNVGIGTSTPSSLFDVHGSSKLGNANSHRLDILGQTIALSGSNTTIEHKAASGNLRIQTTGGSNNKLILSSSGDIEVEQSVTVKNLDTSIQSSGYQSGFAGQGFDINFGEQASAEFDNLTVRGSMRVFELIINQVRATNGALFVSSTGKVDSVEDLGGGNFALLFDTGSGTVGHGFTENDVIRAQQVNRDAIANAGQTQSLNDNLVFRSDLTVTNVQDLKIVTASLQAGSTPPSSSFDFVRLGNTSNTNRQGNVYLTSDDNYAPFIDVVDGITSHSDWNNSATAGGVKVRVGKIDGINSPIFGDLTGFGMWASGSVYLEGSINATSGLIAGWAINPGVLQSNNIYIQSSGSAGGELIKIGQTAGMSGNGIFLSGSGDFNLQSDSSNFIRKSGTDIQVRSENFILNTSNLKIDSTAGGSGSIALGATPPTSYNSGTGFFVDGSGKFLLGNSGGSKIQWDGTNLDVVGSITISNPGDLDVSTLNNDSGFTDDTAANAAQSTATVASSSAATVGNNLTSVSQSFETTTATNTSASAAAQASAITAESNASTAQAAIDTMETQVVLTSEGMYLRSNSNINVAAFGTTTKFFDGVGHADANRKLQLNASGLIAFGDDTNTFAHVKSTGIQLVEDNTEVANFAATTTIGNTSTEHIKISGSGLEIKDGSTTRLSMNGSGMQIGSVANGITLNASGDATFNGTITITGGDIAGLTSSLDSSINTAQSTANTANTSATNASASAASVGNDLTSVSQSFETTTATNTSASAAAQASAITAESNASTAQAAIDTMETQVVLTSEGMYLRSDSNINVAAFGTTTKFFDGVGHADANRKLQLNASGLIAFGDDTNTFAHVKSTGIQLVEDNTEVANFAATTTIGNTSTEHVEVTATSLKLKDGGTTRLSMDSSGMQIGSVSNGITLNSSGNATFNGEITISSGLANSISGSITGQTGSLDTAIGAAQSTANTANTSATNASASAATVGNNLTSVSQSFETTTATNTSASAAAQATAITAESNASTAQAAIDTMETQVVLSSAGMDLRNNSNVNVATFGTTTKFFDGVGHADANRKLQLNASGLIAFGDDVNTFAHVKSTGIQLVEDNTEVANFAATTTIGNTSTEHVEVTATSLKLKDGGTTRLSMDSSGMQIGSVSNGITLNSSGDATFNGEITISSGLANSISGSITGQTGSLDSAISAASSSAAAGQSGSNALNTQVVLNSNGMELKNAASNVTLASYGTTTTIGQDANDKSRIFIDNDSVDLIVDSSGTDTTFASFGATTTVGNTSAEHISIDSDSVDIIQDSNNKAVVSATGLAITQGGSNVASFGANTTITGGSITLNGASTNDQVLINNTGMTVKSNNVTRLTALDTGVVAYGDASNTYSEISSTGLNVVLDGTSVSSFGSSMRVGLDAADKTALRVDSSGNLTIGTSGTSNFTAAANGNVTMAGNVTATAGTIGGWTLGSDSFTNGNVKLSNATDNKGLIITATSGPNILQVGEFDDVTPTSTALSFPATVDESAASSSLFVSSFPRTIGFDGTGNAEKGARLLYEIDTAINSKDTINIVQPVSFGYLMEDGSIAGVTKFAHVTASLIKGTEVVAQTAVQRSSIYPSSTVLNIQHYYTGSNVGSGTFKLQIDYRSHYNRNSDPANFTEVTLTGYQGTKDTALVNITNNQALFYQGPNRKFEWTPGGLTFNVGEVDIANINTEGIKLKESGSISLDAGNIGIFNGGIDVGGDNSHVFISENDFVDPEGYKFFVNSDSSEMILLNKANVGTISMIVDGGSGQPEFAIRRTTSNTEVFRIDENGKVGIGGVDPSEKLHVDGNGLLTGKLGLGGVTPTSTLTVSSATGGVESWVGGILVENTSTTTGEPAIAFRNAGSSGTGDNRWVLGLNQSANLDIAYGDSTGTVFTNANTAIRVNTNKNVGIGGVFTGARLDIVQSADSAGGGIRLRESDDTSDYWDIFLGDEDRLFFHYAGGSNGGFVDDATASNQMNFTGQHRSNISSTQDNITEITGSERVGLIVSADGTYSNIDGGTEPTINDSIPNITLSTTAKDKKVFGVISDEEDLTDGIRTFSQGNFVSTYEVSGSESGRTFVNSIGEGGIWVSNYSGSLENGDYITTSPLSGIGMKQADDLLHNYTVAKITQDCTFSDAGKYTEVEFSGSTYRKQFVGCTYHCG